MGITGNIMFFFLCMVYLSKFTPLNTPYIECLGSQTFGWLLDSGILDLIYDMRWKVNRVAGKYPPENDVYSENYFTPFITDRGPPFSNLGFNFAKWILMSQTDTKRANLGMMTQEFSSHVIKIEVSWVLGIPSWSLTASLPLKSYRFTQ